MSENVAACHARFGRPDSTVVHLAAAGADRALCGVHRGTPAPDLGVTCSACRDKAVRRLPPLPVELAEQQVLADAEAALAGPPLAYVLTGSETATVHVAYSPLLLPLLRSVPGARWDRAARRWVIPAVAAHDVAARLSAAGVTVRLLSERQALCPQCAAAAIAGDSP